MSEEATTSEAVNEGAQQVSKPATSETASVQDSEGPDKGSEYDLKDVPEEFRPVVAKHIDTHKDVEFKRYLTKFTQEKSAEFKQKDIELENPRKQLHDLTLAVNQFLPTVLNNGNGHAPEKKQAPSPPSSESTVEDVLNYLKFQDEKIASLEQGLPQKASEISRGHIKSFQAEGRYENAVNRLRGENLRFKKYEPYIIKGMKDNPEIMKNYTGDNEYDVLKIAVNDFESKLMEDLDSVKQETLNSLKVKKSAATLVPQKSIKFNDQNGGQRSVQESIAAANARLSDIFGR